MAPVLCDAVVQIAGILIHDHVLAKNENKPPTHARCDDTVREAERLRRIFRNPSFIDTAGLTNIGWRRTLAVDAASGVVFILVLPDFKCCFGLGPLW